MNLLFLILLLFQRGPVAQTPNANGVVAGQVMGLNGAPAANLRVSVMEAGEPGQGAEPVARALVAFAQTDASGRYRIDNIPPGRYYILAGQLENPTFYPGAAELERATAVSVTASASVSTLNFALSPDTQSGLIQVVVRRSDTGAPIAGAQVLVRRPNDQTFGATATPVTTDANGQVLIGQLPTGRYTIGVQSEGYVGPPVGQRGFSPTVSGQVSIAGDQKEARIVFSMNPAATIEGRILAPDGRPLSNAAVSALQMGYREGRRGLIASGASNVPTDAQGRYRLSVGAAGEYYIRVETPPTTPRGTVNTVRVAYFPGVADTLKAQSVVAKDAGVTTVPDFTMPSGVAVSGTVTNPFPGGRGGPNGTVNRSIVSFFVVARGENLELNPPSFQNAVRGNLGTSNGPSDFELRGVPVGDYDLYPMFLDNSSGSNTYYTGKTPITVRDTNVGGVRITIRDNPELKGRIVLDGNVPPVLWDSVRIQLRAKETIPSLIRNRANPGPAAAPRPDPATHQFTLPAAEARFGLIFNGLPDTVYVADLRQGSKSLYRDGTVTVGPGAQEDLEVVLKPGASTIQGTVNGATVPFTVVLRPEWSGNLQLYKRGRSSPNGQFALSGVAPGNYVLYALAMPPNQGQGQAEESDEFMVKYEGRGRRITIKESETLVVNDLVMIDDRAAATTPAPPQAAPEISNRVIRTADTPVVTLGATPAAGPFGGGGFGGGRGARGTNNPAAVPPTVR